METCAARRVRKKSRAQVYLEQYRALCIQCDAIEASIADYRCRATRVTQTWQAERVQSTPEPDSRYDAVAEGIDYIDSAMPDYAELLQRMDMQMREIIGVINLIPDAAERSVVYAKYVLYARPGYTWSDIAAYVYYSESRTREIHDNALRTVEKILSGEIEYRFTADMLDMPVCRAWYAELWDVFEGKSPAEIGR